MRQMIKYFHKLKSISFLGMNNMNPNEKLKRKEKKKNDKIYNINFWIDIELWILTLLHSCKVILLSDFQPQHAKFETSYSTSVLNMTWWVQAIASRTKFITDLRTFFFLILSYT